MAKKEIVLTVDEFNAVYRQATRLLEHKTRIASREQRRKEQEYKLLKGLLSRFSQPGPQSKLNRNDVRCIQGICNIARKALDESIIPGYKERMKNENDEKIKQNYQQYIDKGQQAADLYMSIILKTELWL